MDTPKKSRKVRRTLMVEGSFGEWLRGARTHLGLSQRELAEKSGKNTSTIKRYEQDVFMPKTGAFLLIIFDLIQAKIQYLINNSLELANTLLCEEQFTGEGWEQYKRIMDKTERLNKESAALALHKITDQATSDRAVEIMKEKCEISIEFLIILEQLAESNAVCV